MEEEIKVSTETDKCPNCGGKLTIATEGRTLVCEYCGTTVPIPTPISENSEEAPYQGITFDPRGIVKIAYEDGLRMEKEAASKGSLEQKVIHCENCGGNTVITGNSVSHNCIFCNSPHVVDSNEYPQITPKQMIPFSVDEEIIKKAIVKWRRKLLFARTAFKKRNVDDISNDDIYLPFWLYDSDTYSKYKALRGDYYYVSVRQSYTDSNGKNQTRTVQERRIRWTPVSGNYYDQFENLITPGSHSIIKKLFNQIANYEFKEITPFTEKLLTDRKAESYSIKLEASWGNAKADINTILTTRIRNHIGGDVVNNLTFTTDHKNVMFNLVYLPVYVLGESFGKKIYQIVANGQTGKVAGNYPISPWKVLIAVLIVLLIIGGIALGLYFGGVFNSTPA